MEKGGYVYLLTNGSRSVLYTGVTSDLSNRIWEHKNNYYPKSFTAKYKCYMLMYFDFFPEIEDAIEEEKRIKAGSRYKKIKLINDFNPDWKDLYDDIL